MASQATNRISFAQGRRQGSLQALGLGALPFLQLGKFINWGNQDGFQTPALMPWVDLPDSTDAATASSVQPVSTPSAKVAEPEFAPAVATSHAEAQEVVAVVPVAEVVVEQAAEQAEAVRLEAEKLEAEKLEAKKLEEAAKQEAERQEAAKQEADRVAAQKAEQASTDARRAEEAKAAEVKAAEAKAAEERAREQAIAEQKAAAEKLALAEAAERATVAAMPATPTPTPSVIQSSSPNTLPPAQPALPQSAKPIARPTVMDLPPSPVVKVVTQAATHAPQAAFAEVDDYVAKLERLVLELNMELARREDRPSSGNALEDLSQRIIALNLENLALREQLQQPNRAQ